PSGVALAPGARGDGARQIRAAGSDRCQHRSAALLTELHRGSANRRPPALTPARTTSGRAANCLGLRRELPRTEARTAWDAAANGPRAAGAAARSGGYVPSPLARSWMPAVASRRWNLEIT